MKRFFSLLLVVLLLFSLVGCGEKEVSKPTDQKQVKLTLLGWGGVEEKETMEKYLQEFYKENPNIKVEFIQPGDYWAKLKTMIAGGTPPDVFYMGFPEFVEFQKQGVLLNLTPYAKKSKIFDRKDFREDHLLAFSDKNTNDLYGIPKDWSTYVIYYNKKMFEEAGLPTPNEMYKNGKWSYKDFIETARKLTTKEHHGAAIEFGRWKAFIPQTGAEWVSKDGEKVTVDTPEFAKGLQFLADLWLKEKVAPDLNDVADQSPADRFANQKAAMFMSGRWMAMRFKSLDFEWDIAPLPYDAKKYTWVDLVAYCASKDTKHPEEAWKLIEFLTGPKVEEMVAKAGHAIPARKSVANSPAFLESLPINNRAHLEIKSDVLPVFKNWGEVWSALNRHFEPVWSGQKTAKEAVKEAQKEIDELLK